MPIELHPYARPCLICPPLSINHFGKPESVEMSRKSVHQRPSIGNLEVWCPPWRKLHRRRQMASRLALKGCAGAAPFLYDLLHCSVYLRRRAMGP